jgi:acetyl esterase/lipase
MNPKSVAVAAFTLLTAVSSGAGEPAQSSKTWSPGSGRVQVNLWTGKIPSALKQAAPESVYRVTDKPVGGRPWNVIYNVSIPRMTIYKPKVAASKTAVIVYPGGGYNLLAIDLEGSEICEWLNSIGITAILVKYRVPTPKVGRYHESLQALQDAQRAISLVRSKSKALNIDPKKIGVMGFSAGGHLVAAVSTRFSKRSYPRQDAIDDVSCRPDFAVPLYPGHLWQSVNHPSQATKEGLTLNPNITVTKSTPPTFLVQSQDDRVDDPRNSISYFLALKNANVPVELHMFSSGGHAFGLRKGSLPVGDWPNLVERWMRDMKFL